MLNNFLSFIERIFDPAISSAALVAVISLTAFGVVGMALYAVVVALKRRP